MKTLKSLIFCLIVILGVSSFAKAAPLSQTPSILYVKQGGTGDCLSWATACDLQTALSNPSSGYQVWVAAGTYKPTTTDPFDRIATFQLKTGVAIYGGFAGSETSLENRDWLTNPTTLSGNIGTIGVSTDNSYHVVTSSGVDETAVLNGFTISGGNANGVYSHYDGGGMYNSNSRPTLTNLTFIENSAVRGGGMFNISSSSPTLINVTFTENSAQVGGGMYNVDSSPTLKNAIVWGNEPALQIDKTGTGSVTVTYSDIQGVVVYPGPGNINADPLLGPLANNGGFTQTLALGYGSPAIDAGTAVCTPTDQRGYPRPIDGDGNGSAICDMGAYEYYHTVYLPILMK